MSVVRLSWARTDKDADVQDDANTNENLLSAHYCCIGGLLAPETIRETPHTESEVAHPSCDVISTMDQSFLSAQS